MIFILLLSLIICKSHYIITINDFFSILQETQILSQSWTLTSFISLSFSPSCFLFFSFKVSFIISLSRYGKWIIPLPIIELSFALKRYMFCYRSIFNRTPFDPHYLLARSLSLLRLLRPPSLPSNLIPHCFS